LASRSSLRTLVSGTSTSAIGSFADVHTSTEQASIAQPSETAFFTHPEFQQSFWHRQPPHLRRWLRAGRTAGLAKRNQRRHGHSETRRFMTLLRPPCRCDAYLPILCRGRHPYVSFPMPTRTKTVTDVFAWPPAPCTKLFIFATQSAVVRHRETSELATVLSATRQARSLETIGARVGGVGTCQALPSWTSSEGEDDDNYQGASNFVTDHALT